MKMIVAVPQCPYIAFVMVTPLVGVNVHVCRVVNPSGHDVSELECLALPGGIRLLSPKSGTDEDCAIAAAAINFYVAEYRGPSSSVPVIVKCEGRWVCVRPGWKNQVFHVDPKHQSLLPLWMLMLFGSDTSLCE